VVRMRLNDSEWRSLSKLLGFGIRLSYKDLRDLSKKQEQLLIGWFYQNVELPGWDLE